jgi:hypothetical protein
MDSFELKLGTKSFKLKFGLKLFRILGEKWNLPGINEVVQKMAVLDTVEQNLTFAQFDVLEDIIYSAIICGGAREHDLAKIDIIDEFFKDPKALQNLVNNLVASLPNQSNETGKQKAARVK